MKSLTNQEFSMLRSSDGLLVKKYKSGPKKDQYRMTTEGKCSFCGGSSKSKTCCLTKDQAISYNQKIAKNN